MRILFRYFLGSLSFYNKNDTSKFKKYSLIINNQITYIPLSEILVGNYVIKIFGKDFSQTKQLLIVQ